MDYIYFCTQEDYNYFCIIYFCISQVLNQQVDNPWSDNVMENREPLWPVNTLRPWQNGCRFIDNIFKCLFLNENEISMKISLKGLINNIQALVQIKAWRRPGNKPLSEAMMEHYQCIYASLSLSELIHWGSDTLVTILRTSYSNHFLHENWRVLNQISLKFVPKGSLDNKPALV